MSLSSKMLSCCIIAFCLTSRVVAESTPPSMQAHKVGTLTGKERLGRKWTDEQRIDNCNVPSDKRGAKARPFACSSPLTN